MIARTRRTPAAAPSAPDTRLRVLGPALVLAALLTIYAATACRTTGPADACEFTVVMTTWGVAHAPGFPLQSLLGNLVSLLPHPGEPAFALNLMNALFAALACAVLAISVQLLTGQAWAGVAAGLALGTSRIFWENALIDEAFALNTLLGALLLALWSRWARHVGTGPPAGRTLPAAALVLSGVLTHHTTLVLLAGPFVVMVAVTWIAARRRGAAGSVAPLLVRCALFAGLGLLPLLYLPLAARLDPPLDWGNPRDLHALLDLLLRRDFGSGTLAVPGIAANQVLQHGEAASPLGMRQYLIFWSRLPESFGWVFPALAIAGLLDALRRFRATFALALLFFAALTLFFTRVNTPVVPLYVGITQRFYLLPHLVLAWLAGIGIAGIADRTPRALPRGPALATAVLIGCTSVAMAFTHWRAVDQRANTFTRDFGANLLAGVPERALLFSNGDLQGNSVYYQQATLGHRRDVSLIDQPMMGAPWYVEQLRRRNVLALPAPSSPESAEALGRTRAWLDLCVPRPGAKSARPVVALQLMDDSYRDAYRMIPMGLWAAVVPRGERPDLRAWTRDFVSVVRRWQVRSLDGSYAPTSWEADAGVFYPYALGSLRALVDMAGLLGALDSSHVEVEALTIADRWQGTRRAEYLAQQADFWFQCLVDSLVPADARTADLLASRALALARASLSLDSTNVQALQTTAALVSSIPSLRDPELELSIRRRIARERPGDIGELAPYFQLALAMMKDPATRDPEILAQAEAVRRRFITVVGISRRISPDPMLATLEAQWSTPLPALVGP